MLRAAKTEIPAVPNPESGTTKTKILELHPFHQLRHYQKAETTSTRNPEAQVGKGSAEGRSKGHSVSRRGAHLGPIDNHDFTGHKIFFFHNEPVSGTKVINPIGRSEGIVSGGNRPADWAGRLSATSHGVVNARSLMQCT